MVAVADSDTGNRVSPRLLRMLRDAELPGDQRDHEWIGQRIEDAAEKLTDSFPHEFGQDLILSGLAVELGLDVSRVEDLEGQCFPESWLRSIPSLLRCGFPKASWRLIESGVLTCECDAPDSRHAWKINLQLASSLVTDTYELGTHLLLQVLIDGLMGVAHGRETNTRFRLVANSLPEARDWVFRLKQEWDDATPRPLIVAG